MKLKTWLLTALFCVVSSAAAVQVSAETKVGVMNVQKVINLSDAGKVAKTHFEGKMKEMQGKFKAEEEALVALQQEIEKKGTAWSEQKKQDKVREFQKARRELQTKTEDARFELKQLQEKELQPILKALEGVVKSFGKKNGYTMIVDIKSGVIYFEESIDVSAEITKELNTAMKK
ncbi:OmpH family outer membrane protein [Desulfopila sp. IMCC35008]|uniref:OmpH family outer membrane protein n=1 Tax=Desulfopila sp. IMCC35008 TaxID=2653858 RepID=UPI0013CFD82D|nr:OmpH family outer membrane protein [Desulfopila sp. IMCC35008]